MKKLLLFLCLSVQIGFAQSHRIDSLKQALIKLHQQPNGYTKDTLRYHTLKAIMRGYGEVNVDSAFYYNDLLMKLSVDIGLQNELIYVNAYRGILYQLKGRHYQSIHFHYKALSLAEKQRQYPQIAAAYGELAQAYSSLNRDALALKLCEKGLALLHSHPSSNTYQEQLGLLNVQGWVYGKLGRYTESLNVSQEMYRLARVKPGDLWYEINGLHAIGIAFKGLGDVVKAMVYHKKALILLRSSKTASVELEGNILVNMADMFIHEKNWQQALVYCKQGKKMALRVKNSKIVAEADGQLHVIYKNLGQPQKALKAHEDHISLRDSLSKEENEQRIETLRAQYDLQNERMNRQAERNRDQQTRNGLFLGIATILLVAVLLFWNNRRLQAKNREIDRQRVLLETAREQLAESNKTLETRVDERTGELVKANRELIRKNEEIKQALFKGQTIERKRVALELHDNLSSLLSAVNMSIQSINPQNLPETEQSVYRNVKQLIQNAYAEVRNISHNILPAELEKDGLATTLTTLVSLLNQNSPLQFSLTITDLRERLPVEIEFNVYSIVLELINNAIKHAKATTVGISLYRTDSGISLSVTDDGIGLGQNHDKRGVGLQNIQTRLDSLGGTFETLMPTEKGTRIDVKIPIEAVRLNGNVSVV